MSSFRRFDSFFTSSLFSQVAAWEAEDHFRRFDIDLAFATSTFFHFDLPPRRPLPPPSSFDAFAPAADLAAFRRLQDRAETEMRLRSLSDRVTALELGLGQGFGGRPSRPLDRKYTWTAEIKDDYGLVDRKYKWVAEAKGRGEKGFKWMAEIKDDEGFDRKYKWEAEAKAIGDGNVKWMTEFKGKGPYAPTSRTYTWKASTKPTYEEEEDEDEDEINEKKLKKGKKEKNEKGKNVQLVKIEDKNRGAIAIRRAFAKAYKYKEKREFLSVQEAATFIQKAYRDHLARRSVVLRCLRELAVAKARLKDLRELFSNFNYRRFLAKDAEERQKFTDKIIVLHLTLKAIEGPDFMVRAAKKSMIEELEFMLQVVDPQLAPMKQRKFDLPDGWCC